MYSLLRLTLSIPFWISVRLNNGPHSAKVEISGEEFSIHLVKVKAEGPTIERYAPKNVKIDTRSHDDTRNILYWVGARRKRARQGDVQDQLENTRCTLVLIHPVKNQSLYLGVQEHWLSSGVFITGTRGGVSYVMAIPAGNRSKIVRETIVEAFHSFILPQLPFNSFLDFC
ncbi:MAG: hypothetical protein NXY59_02255 [Aigarchaeota archaeon]|nr:hypothetical protein [Candidatus Pelearchaeum maunauluense]